MLERAARQLQTEPGAVAARVGLVEAAGEDVADAVDDPRFGAVLCHGVLMYLDDPAPLVDSLCSLVAPGGLMSIVTKNVRNLATRPALAGDWAAALACFDGERQINGLGVDTRGDDVERLSAHLAARGVDPVEWYGVRLFTDGWTPERPATDPEQLVLAVELEASRRDPYRSMSRLFHLVGRRP
jgi:SAM-dependent methyltransferase